MANKQLLNWRRLILIILITLGVCLLAGLFTVWYLIGMPGRSWRGALPEMTAAQKGIEEGLRRDVQTLAGEIGDRNLWHMSELDRAAEFIAEQFHETGYTVTREGFTADKKDFQNLIAEKRGSVHSEEIVIVGAHYDTCAGTPGANDNTSGVAAMLAIARDMAGRSTERTVRFVAFVNEEPPYFQTEEMGSRVHARNCRQRGDKIVAMLSLETIGCYKDAPGSQKLPYPFGALYPSTGNYIAFVGNTGSRSLVRRCVKTFRRAERFPSEGGALPEFLPASGLSDQWSFWQEGYPGLMVTDTAFFRYDYYHTVQDTPEKLQYDRLARVVEGLSAVVRELAGAR